MKAIVAKFAQPLEAFRHEVVAELAEPLEVTTCRIAPCELGHLVAESMLQATHGGEIAIMNAGGIRVGLPAGKVTRGRILEALPYGNTVATMQLTGADLEAALRTALTKLGGGPFPQWAGLRLGLGGFEVRAGEGWAPLDPARRYRVVTNNFLRGGGDGYTVFRDKAIDPYDAGPGLDEAFVTALAVTNPPK